MKSRDFCYWVQGYFEILAPAANSAALSAEQVQVIKNHLNMVFKHEIDPSNGTPEHNKELSELHKAALGPIGGVGGTYPKFTSETLANC